MLFLREKKKSAYQIVPVSGAFGSTVPSTSCGLETESLEF